MRTAAELCQDVGVTVHQVGEVYGAAPPEFLKKFFIATSADLPGLNVEALPLSDTEAEAYDLALRHLYLKRNQL